MQTKKLGLVVIVVLALFMVDAASLRASSEGPALSADQALNMLKEGSDRFVSGSVKHPDQSRERRSLTTAKGQHPYATVLTCSDSRVPVEIVFDSGIGDIFVVRVAGNVTDVDEAGSIEYGVDHLGTPVLVVLGHTHCGAVTAVVQQDKVHGNIPPLVENIQPAVAKAKASHPQMTGEALVEEAVKANVWQSIEDLFRISQAAREKVKSGGVKVVGAVYDIDSGKIEWMGSHPEQDQLIAKYGASDAAHGKE